MATRKTTKKTVENKETVATKEAVAPEKNIFQKMAGIRSTRVTEVETVVGTVSVRDRISVGEMSSLVNTIVAMCIDDRTGDVRWELVEFVTKLLVVATYCGLDVPEIDDGYNSVMGEGGLYHAVEANIDMHQLNGVWHAVDEKLRARQEMNVATGVARLNELLDAVQGLMDEVGKMSEGFDGEQAMIALDKLSNGVLK